MYEGVRYNTEEKTSVVKRNENAGLQRKVRLVTDSFKPHPSGKLYTGTLRTIQRVKMVGDKL